MKSMEDKVLSAISISEQAEETVINNNQQTRDILVFHSKVLP